ncbi:MAG TPA: CPBP family intramembrane glutamic endopeptidase [Candidatus Dormibacteraeota bacterium]|nr:CPBP family intramembrane glutamic endopeptidase [Candidatus Dormibacteraeota bacterium]
MVIAANAAVGKPWAHHATGILAGLMAGSVFLFGIFDLTVPGSVHNPPAVDFAIMATGLIAAALASKPVRERTARVIPIDPDSPVHSLAMVLAVILVGTQLASLAFTNVLAAEQALPPLSIGDLLAQEAPFLVIALAGVGLWVRRDTAATAQRLGLVRPAWWQVVLALAAAGAFYAVAQGFEQLSQALSPTLAQQVNRTSGHVFGGLTASVAGIVLLGVIPGVCEEVLFRGALQPRFGLVVTAVLFAAIHAEYGLSIDLISIFVIALGLGLIRKYTNTSASGTTHVAYNVLIGINLSGLALAAGAAVEVALVLVVIYAVWSMRRRHAEAVVETTRVS